MRTLIPCNPLSPTCCLALLSSLLFLSHTLPLAPSPPCSLALPYPSLGTVLKECRNLTVPAGLKPGVPPSFPLPPAALYVDYSAGSDAAAGTQRAPLKTVAAALARVATAGGAGGAGASAGAGATHEAIVLRGGVHYLSATLEMTAQHSSLTLMNFPGERAFLSGAVPLPSPAWKRWKGPIWSADLGDAAANLDDIVGLRVGGRRGIRARYPNADPEFGFGPALTADGFLPIDNSSWATLVDIYPASPNRTGGSGAQSPYVGCNPPPELMMLTSASTCEYPLNVRKTMILV